ncbi:MAG: glycosyltransferase [Kiritimatiellae bacterium]|nr:glycosyltransferase [Kiritimatiellia bacterium]
MNPETSIVIRARDEGACLEACVAAIRNQSYSDYEIICVYDPRSIDDTLAVAQSLSLRIITLDANAFSFGRSINIGFEAALGTFGVLVSAHACPADPQWLEQLLAPLQGNDRAAATYSRQIPTEEAYTFWHRELARSYPPEPGAPTVAFSNVSSCIRLSAWNVCRFDEALTGTEDLAWALAAREAGHDIVYAPGSVIHHSHNESPAQVIHRAQREALALFAVGARQATTHEFVSTIAGTLRAMIKDTLICLAGRESPRQLGHALTYRAAFCKGHLKGWAHVHREKR